ncbi:S8 family serine peptidase [Photobacterium damselae]|uniref:S8 family serine peptidase n=1 Tax=Photobacterium damselae TaxID=38293 RepID=UPI0040689DFF
MKSIVYSAMLGLCLSSFSINTLANNKDIEYANEGIRYESITIKIPKNTIIYKDQIFDTIKGKILALYPDYDESSFFIYDIKPEKKSSLSQYIKIKLRTNEQKNTKYINEIIDNLNDISNVELIYPEPVPETINNDRIPSPISYYSRSKYLGTPNYEDKQYYLKSSEDKKFKYFLGGIDAYYAWDFPGGDGAGITIVQKEIDQWNEDHEDLPPSIYQFSGSKKGEHGTAAMGIMGGLRNGFGITGIAYNASFARAGSTSSNFPEIMDKLKSGDVIQIGIQVNRGPIAGCTSSCYQPMESSDVWFNFIKELTDKGVHVIQAAGNGSLDLDHPDFEGKFNRSIRDSGSNLVGAVCANNGKTAGFSNYGSRIDSSSWGCWDVVTTGYSGLSAEHNANYTSSFSGTSSANPIVAGATAVLSGIAKHNNINLPPKKLRNLMTETGTIVGSDNKYIATQPNLKNTIDKLLDIDDISNELTWDIKSLNYDLGKNKITFSFDNRLSEIDGFTIRLYHNGKNVSFCKENDCYNSESSVVKGIKSVHVSREINIGDRFEVITFDKDRNVISKKKLSVSLNWKIKNMWYNSDKQVRVSFFNEYSKNDRFYIRISINSKYTASCKKETCYYSYATVYGGIKTIHDRDTLKSGDVVTAEIRDSNIEGTLIDRRIMVVR